MSHPHKALLDEFQFAIHHFVPTLPDTIKQEAQKIHDDLLADETTDETTIKQAFHDIGVQEYPYRHAYQELITTKEEGKMNQLVLEHVDGAVKAVIEPLVKDGVYVEELVKSDLIAEKLSPEQVYQIEDGIMVAKSKLAEAIKKHVSDDEAAHEALLKKWQEHTKTIEEKIETLKAFAQKGDETQKTEILNRVQFYKEGFLVTEEDPDPKEIDEEIAYWQEAFEEAV